MPEPDDGALTYPFVPAEGVEPRPSGEGLTAILCAHGMGQQVPYETLQMVVDGLENAPGKAWEVEKERSMALVRVGGEDLRRIELTLRSPKTRADGTRETRKVHVYEAYWAPLTEGKVRLRDVVSFLVSGGLAGLGKAGGAQRRWLFGAWRTFPPSRGATLALFMALLVIAALAAMNLVAFAIVGLQALPSGFLEKVPEAMQRGVAEEVTRSLLAFLLLVGTLGAWIGVSAWAVKRARKRPNPEKGAAWLGRLTDAGMAAFAWTLSGAMAFLVATAASVLAYGWCMAKGCAAPDDATRRLAWGATLVLVLAALLLPRRARLLGGGLLLALLAASVDAVWDGAAFPWLPPILAVAGLAVAAGAALWDFVAGAHPKPGSRDAPRWHYWLLFGNVLVAFLALSYGMTLAPALPLVGGGEWGLLAGVAAFAVLASLVAALAGAALDRKPSWDAQLWGYVLAALALVVALVVLLLALSRQPLVAQVLVAWGLVAVVALTVRGLLVQFVGDVAAYVSPHKLDRFAEVRAEVKARVKAVADAIYGMRTPDGTRLVYDRVVPVGHSLGSVVTYDTLNGLILDDMHASVRAPRPGDKPSDHPRLVLERTPVLVTFGSPLDRTAFIFSTQRDGGAAKEKETPPRDAGAAVAGFAQPLIAWPPARNDLLWVNVHSRADVISSALTYYDVPQGQWREDEPRVDPVTNREDDLAATPLVGHVDYWKNHEVWRAVVDAVFLPERGYALDP